MIERITDKEAIIAIIIRAEYESNGIEFFTPNDFSQQLGYMNRPAGYIVEPHSHQVVKRTVSYTQEVLYIKSGTVKVLLYGSDLVFLTEKILSAGDIILLSSGGHGLQILEEAQIIEIKQGPYGGLDDKIKIVPAKRSNDCEHAA